MAKLQYKDRTDNVQEKLQLLQTAYASGNHDLAMSLSESIKETIAFERQSQAEDQPPQIGADDFAPVNDLPAAWARWAKGWSFCKTVTLFETVGIKRLNEPVDVSVGFRSDQTNDLTRDLRVARLDPLNGTLHEIPSQIYAEVRHGKERRCRLVFFADVPAHESATFLIFYGNPYSELPKYSTDLRVTGEGYGLDIENDHFIARLSRQMGQLERLTYKREHGLELYAGGKGHGEPPNIDWGHDYVDPGHFQKLRMRNWPKCPNYEVVKGPLFVSIRRWGFPFSPIHPLFTPSRVHMDQTYIFYAGLPYFLKQGRFDMIKDVRVDAMRDDEWVFSGYSFTNTVWFDRNGKLHEGGVPGEHSRDLWGVGFYHRDSRDAFIALWLEHEAKNFDGLKHDGAPILHYDGHGQLWARYPVNGAQFEAGASIRQKNAYLVSPFPKQNAAAKIESVRHQLVNPLEVRAGELGRPGGAKAAGSLARIGETEASAPLKSEVWKVLRQVRDEQIYHVDANVVDMGYVYDLRVRDGVVHVLLTMPHRGRPVYQFLLTEGGGRVKEGLQERLLKLKGVRDVVVDFTWEPAWNVTRLTEAGRKAMGLPL